MTENNEFTSPQSDVLTNNQIDDIAQVQLMEQDPDITYEV